ncbi:hypothetical protein [Streptomyces noursei]|uniref:hypothetical protein n=1 Tax=Streptomyces noursei TaxID=1971 RepID=UPI0030F17A44
MSDIDAGVAALFVAVAFTWPIVPLMAYPRRRWRGMWAAVYCGVAGFVMGYVIFRYNHHMVGTFFQASVYTSVVRIVIELTGGVERLRRRWATRISNDSTRDWWCWAVT